MRTVIVVPCFNEESRWDDDYWAAVGSTPGLGVLFVNDGSTDGTQRRIDRTCVAIGARSLHLGSNAGKAEALRRGLIEALSDDSDVVGYLDADGAFPAEEVTRLVALAQDLLKPEGGGYDAVWSARVLMAGRDIQRHASRHYIGRVITTLLSPIHRYAVYDTQSGYKLFRNEDELRTALAPSFQTRWFPDIELLMRWEPAVGHPMRIWEEPVMGWHDVAGSKMNRSQYLTLLRDLGRLRRLKH